MLQAAEIDAAVQGLRGLEGEIEWFGIIATNFIAIAGSGINWASLGGAVADFGQTGDRPGVLRPGDVQAVDAALLRFDQIRRRHRGGVQRRHPRGRHREEVPRAVHHVDVLNVWVRPGKRQVPLRAENHLGPDGHHGRVNAAPRDAEVQQVQQALQVADHCLIC